MTDVSTTIAPPRQTAVLHVGGLHYASEKSVVERALGARPGVVSVEANSVAQTATVTYDPARTSVADLRAWVEECGYLSLRGPVGPGPCLRPDGRGGRAARRARPHGDRTRRGRRRAWAR